MMEADKGGCCNVNRYKIPVLIDANNIAEKYISQIFDELSKDGIATYKRIYGDWTAPSLASWKPTLLNHSILPIQQYNYTTGKNSTDSAMIIDAMDILYTGQVNGFCIVSSDSDFTRLAARLRESGMQVVGMGEQKTPKPFIAACNQFKYLDILWQNAEKNTALEKKHAPDAKQTKAKAAKDKAKQPPIEVPNPMTSMETIKAAIQTIIDEGSDEDGWMFCSQVGALLAKRYPDFDVRNYQFAKLTQFLESLDEFEMKREAKAHLIRIREEP